jgi:Helix-hairpin-helix motif
MKRAFASLLAAGILTCSWAQVTDPGSGDPQNELRDVIEQRVEAVAEQLGDNNNVDLTVLTDMLMDIAKSPIDLNHTDAQELARLQLLSDVQISAILEHERRFGPLLSFYELQTIDGLDPRTLQLIRPFVRVNDNINATRASFKEVWKNATHEFLTRTLTDVQQRKGFIGRTNLFGQNYTDPDGTPLPDVSNARVLDSLRLNNQAYLGSPYKLFARYRFRYRQNISFGITAEKDEGEQFFKGTQSQGFDFYSAHLFLRNVGPVKALALGDFQAQFGQGLVFWSGLAYASKSAFTMNIKRNGSGLQAYSSVNENLFLRGAGVTVDLGRHLSGTGFISRKGYDANVPDPDAPTAENVDQEATFSALLNDGYHRTYREAGRKDAIQETIMGGNIRYKRATWSLGATAANVRYSSVLVRNLQPYNQFEFQGQQNTTYGGDWNVLYRNLTWFGEVARSSNGGMAGLSGLLIALDKRLSLAMLYRDYQRNYQGLYSVAFAESTNPWNERGLYTGIELKPTREWSINAYMDQFRFPWLRYLTNAPSSGSDVLVQTTWKPNKKVEIYGRFRHQERLRNATTPAEGITPLVPVAQNNVRFNASYKVSDGLTLRTRIERVDYQRGDTPKEHGFLMYQDFVHRPLASKVELTGRIAVFSSDTYNARLYAYENDVIGLFSIPPYYGRGMRWYGMVRWTATRGVDVWFRYGAWLYNGQDRSSSGLQEISGDRKSDVKLEVRVHW